MTKPDYDSSSNNPDFESEINTKKNNLEETSDLAVPKADDPSLFSLLPYPNKPEYSTIHLQEVNFFKPWLLVTSLVIMFVGLIFDLSWVGLSGTLVALFLSLRVVIPSIKNWIGTFLTKDERNLLIGSFGFILALLGLAKYLGFYRKVTNLLTQFKYDEFGSWAEWVGAVGQVAIAILAVYVAWQQYVISKDLTIQQNRITQQQTIDAYFQGISELALNQEGMLEDWPQERAIAEGRTAAILSSVDAGGKAKILRFLSQSKLLTPLKRDSHLGRPILDGFGGYEEDREYGVRVIDLGVILAATDLSGTDLRWTELSEANMVRANLSYCDLVKANLSRTILYEAILKGADFKSARLFYGSVELASPRSRSHLPDYNTGAYTGAVLENANFLGVQRLSEEQRYYCCCWGGKKTRATIPGGCEGIPNKLGR